MIPKILVTLMLILNITRLKAQSNQPDNSLATVPASSKQPITGLPGTENKPRNQNDNFNYIVSWEPQVPVTTDNQVTTGGRTVEEMHRTIQYFDGLGRPVQTINWQQTAAKKDLVSVNLYDEFGREQYRFLQFEANKLHADDATGDGYFKFNPFAQQSNFSGAQYPGEKFYYGHTVYEASPLNRTLKTFAPGNSWAGSEGTGSEKAVTVNYEVNLANEGVRIWNITNNTLLYDVNKNIVNTLNLPSTTKVYNDGQLFKIITKDEHGKQTIEYKDKDDHIVLKKVQIENNPSSSHTGWLCTYYVYDDLGLLRFVLPPQSVASSAAWNDKPLADELTFRYEYDERHRIIAKKVPGAAWVYMVYDNRDRLVYTQDGNMRKNNQWMANFYDVLNRQVMTGIISTPSTHQQLIAYARSAAYNTPAVIENISCSSNPLINGSTYTRLTATFYDNYNFTTTEFIDAYKNKLEKLDVYANAESYPSAPTSNTVGLVTGAQVRVIGATANLLDGIFLETVNFYDEKGRLIQINNDNISRGKDIVSNLYDFTGKVISSYVDHTNGELNANIHWGVGTDMQYDHYGRLLKIKKRTYYKNEIIQTTKLVENTYNALGQLLVKKLGQQKDANGYNTLATPIEALNYEYNIRGWLKSINKNYAKYNSTSTVNWFGMQLNYDWGFNRKEYNGNISGITWRSKGDGEKRAYGFGYDNTNRLLFADFNQYTGSAWNKTASIDFSVKMGNGVDHATAYDNNGNIKSMQEKGIVIQTSGIASTLIDDLSYSYFPNSNKLKSVNDAASGFKLGDFANNNTTNNDYGYDVNGNLITDRNKRFNGSDGLNLNSSQGAIQYNFLNLPASIRVSNDQGAPKGDIKYVYDATGNKLQKIVLDYSGTSKSYITVTDYIGLFVYETKDSAAIGTTPVLKPGSKRVLQFINHEEGRMRAKFANVDDTDPSGINFDYFLKDHLGNVRMVLTDEQRQDVYPVADVEQAITASLNYQKAFYDIVDGNISDENSIPGFINKQTSDPANYDYKNNNGNPPYNTNPEGDPSAKSRKMYRLNGANGAKTGLGITLKVMSGDVVEIFGKSYYHQSNGQLPDNTYLINSALVSFLNAIAFSPAVMASHNNVTGTILNNNPSTSGPLNAWLTGSVHTATDNNPQAYINWVFFDEHFKTITANGYSGADPVAAGNEVLKSHYRTVSIKKNGYLYVYCSNESALDVFFDNLQVIHTRGPLLEETHYYPFGLRTSGISSKALSFGKPENNRKFNGGSVLQSNEFLDLSGLELYFTQFRSLDPQLGRWWQLDPLAGASFNTSPYAYVLNNPLLFNDPFGLDTLKRTSNGELPGTRPNGSALVENDMIIDENGSVVYYNGQSWQQEKTAQTVTVSNKKSGWGGFYWPEYSSSGSEMNYWRGQMFIRIKNHEKLINGNEPVWVKDNIEQYLLEFKAEQDYRNAQIVAVMIITSPMIIATIGPSTVSAASSLYTEMAGAYLDGSILLHYETNLALDYLKRKVLEAVLTGAVNKLGTDALYNQNLWKVSNEIKNYSQPIDSKTMAKFFEQVAKQINNAKKH